VLKRRPAYSVDKWDGEIYQRMLSIDGLPAAVSMRQLAFGERPALEVTAHGLEAHPDAEAALAHAVERLTGLQVDLSGFYALAAGDPILEPMVERFRGAKPTRYPSLFECLTNAIICQLVTLEFGLTVVSRLVEGYGPTFELDDQLLHGFPSPTVVARIDPDELRAIGFSRQKARALIELAEKFDRGELRDQDFELLSDEEALERLISLRGVGRWTAEYTQLRGLGRLHIFPGDDVGARNTLRRWLSIEEKLDYAGVRETLGAWQQYAGLLYFHMLLLGLEAKGLINGESTNS
jgi:DNA-3-methyladenine glycosylase II